jgi:hypothetical protein
MSKQQAYSTTNSKRTLDSHIDAKRVDSSESPNPEHFFFYKERRRIVG